ncbi:diaminopimelate epimerase [Prevotella communis]|uniref:diaminopimelate epimerase n=1 Tax=Prevotella communis TaxID=2913614 RepID=UPI001EDA3AE8|nr:diaminopimelate epimerase [Prevotella communis]UKK67643.1 diaminopimelate epimerase [Prevotella communis]UKK70210.1 diaminopimelate epimerase [Prevotella communis]
MSKIPFTKMHGCGNDYIYVNVAQHPIDDPKVAAIKWSDRHKGIGSDGLVLIGKSSMPEADFTMRIFNADGSEAMMCGNASRCIGKYLFGKGLTTKTEIRLLTLSGIKVLYLHITDDIVESVTVDMGEPILEDATQFIASRGLDMGTFVSMGNPHFVIFTENVDQVGETGRSLEYHPAFPQRCNIEFAHIEADGSIRTRVWERGSGITQACGTGACATAVAAALTGKAGRTSQIVMDGGTLNIEWCEADRSDGGRFFQKNHVYMTGPAAFVFDGELEQ